MAIPDALLATLGFDVFEPDGDAFRRLGPPPAWAGAFPEVDGTVDLRASDFLQEYLDAAAHAWEDGEPLAPSVWTEAGADGVTRTLEVTPLIAAGRHLILIGPHRVEAEQARYVLQTARDNVLAADAERRRTAERETLLHCIVHDLSNPLAGLRGSLKLLGEAAHGDDAELVAIGLRSADRMQATIRSVLDAFAASVDPLLPSAEPPTADLAAAARRAVDAAGPSARTSGVELSLPSRTAPAGWAADEPSPGSPSGRGDSISEAGSVPEAATPEAATPEAATPEAATPRDPSSPPPTTSPLPLGEGQGEGHSKPTALLVVAEPERLERAVANLVANAIRHAERAVRVELTSDDAHATVSVRDDGPGIAPELRPRLFRPLVQGADGGAVGLGLHSVRLAAEAWGGEAGETPGDGLGADARGAHVWLRLPRA